MKRLKGMVAIATDASRGGVRATTLVLEEEGAVCGEHAIGGCGV